MVDEAQNICDNVCLWDGNPDTWTPPPGYLMLPQATTPSKTWGWDGTQWVLVPGVGAGEIGFTWDGTYLITDDPEPVAPPAREQQPTVTGAQTI